MHVLSEQLPQMILSSVAKDIARVTWLSRCVQDNYNTKSMQRREKQQIDMKMFLFQRKIGTELRRRKPTELRLRKSCIVLIYKDGTNKERASKF